MKLNQCHNRIRAKLESMSYFKFIFVQLLLLFVFLVFEGISYYAAVKLFSVDFDDSGWSGSFVRVVLTLSYVAIKETLLFQFLPYKIINLFHEEKPKRIDSVTLYIIVSSILFGLGHFFINLQVCVVILIARVFFKCVGAGVILSYTYYVADKKKWKPFWTVSLIHFIFNLILYISSTI